MQNQMMRLFRRGAAVVATAMVLFPFTASARGGGGSGHSIGFSGATISASQEHINTLIRRANTREGGITTGALDNAYEVGVLYGYRFSGSVFSLMLRPTFFYQVEEGTGASGAFEYGVTGFTVMPILRLYPLENDFMKFFMQFGLGYGRANSSIKEGTAEVKMAGGAFGTSLGLGAEFCFTANHCMVTEGNYRYMTMERNIAKSVSGSFDADGLDQPVKDREVEMNETDLAVRMSGLQFMLGYTFYF